MIEPDNATIIVGKLRAPLMVRLEMSMDEGRRMMHVRFMHVLGREKIREHNARAQDKSDRGTTQQHRAIMGRRSHHVKSANFVPARL